MILFLGIGLTILWFLFQSLNQDYQEDCLQRGILPSDCSLWDKLWTDLRSAKVFWLVVIVVCFFISNISRALRWQQLVSSLGHPTRGVNAFLTTMLGYFANLGLPRFGELVRAASFARYEKIAFEKVMGTVAVDRVVDLLSFAILFLLALVLQFDILWTYIKENASLPFISIFQSLWFYLALIVGTMCTILIFWQWQKFMHIKIFQKIDRMARGFLEGLRSVGQLDQPFSFIAHSLIIWLMYYLMTYLCFKAFEPTAALSPMAALLVFVFGSLGMIVPSPGGMGSYHALVIAGLALYGIKADDAFSFAMIIFFTINIFGNILFGILALLLLPGYNHSYQPIRS